MFFVFVLFSFCLQAKTTQDNEEISRIYKVIEKGTNSIILGELSSLDLDRDKRRMYAQFLYEGNTGELGEFYAKEMYKLGYRTNVKGLIDSKFWGYYNVVVKGEDDFDRFSKNKDINAIYKHRNRMINCLEENKVFKHVGEYSFFNGISRCRQEILYYMSIDDVYEYFSAVLLSRLNKIRGDSFYKEPLDEIWTNTKKIVAPYQQNIELTASVNGLKYYRLFSSNVKIECKENGVCVFNSDVYRFILLAIERSLYFERDYTKRIYLMRAYNIISGHMFTNFGYKYN